MGKGPGQGHTDVRLEARVRLTPKPWLRVGCGPWDTEGWLGDEGVRGGPKGERHCPEQGPSRRAPGSL